MGKIERVKSRLLREAVAENVDLIQGRWRRRSEERSALARALARGAWMLALPVGLLASAGGTLPPSLTQGMVPTTSSSEVSAKPPTEASPALPRVFQPPSAIAPVIYPPPQPVDPQALPLAVRTVVVDPGHGGTNRGTGIPGGLVEKQITLDIGERLASLLREAGFRVVMTRDRDESVSLEERAAIANHAEGDIFVSIHVNWIFTRSVRGVETYYLGPTDDPELTRLAARENQESGYSLADMRKILDGIYADVRQDESHRLAEAIEHNLYSALRKVNPRLENRGVKRAPFVVLVATDMPAVLAEVSCLSNPQEAKLLADEDYRQYIAYALYDGIQAYADSSQRPTIAERSGNE